MQDQNLILVISVSLTLLIVIFAFVVVLLLQHQKNVREKQNELFRAVLEAEEKEQNRLGQNLHDDMCPLLAIASTQLNFAATEKDINPELASNLLGIWQQLTNINSGLRQLSHELVAFDVKGKTLGQAFETYTLQHYQLFDDIHCDIDKEFNQLLPSAVSQLFRIGKELVHNAVKHSKAKQLWVELKVHDNHLLLSVADNGIGFDCKSSDGIGLQNIKQRAQFINAQFLISQKDNETTALLSYPLKKSAS